MTSAFPHLFTKSEKIQSEEIQRMIDCKLLQYSDFTLHLLSTRSLFTYFLRSVGCLPLLEISSSIYGMRLKHGPQIYHNKRTHLALHSLIYILVILLRKGPLTRLMASINFICQGCLFQV